MINMKTKIIIFMLFAMLIFFGSLLVESLQEKMSSKVEDAFSSLYSVEYMLGD